jgi:Phage integrase family
VLAAESREALKTIGLHYHDLRREAGSRWLDGGMSLHAVRDLLGHANVSQTDTYLAANTASLHEQMARYETRVQQIATPPKTRGKTKVQATARRNTKTNKDAVGRHPAIM